MDTFTLQQVAEHNTPQNAWIAIHGNVYDVSKYLYDHPGGREVLQEVAGTDATEDFEYAGHSDNAQGKLEKLRVGTLDHWVKKQELLGLGHSPQTTKTHTSLRGSTRRLLPGAGVVTVCGVTLLRYNWDIVGNIPTDGGGWFWPTVSAILAVSVVFGGIVGLLIRNTLFNHGKGAFQYPPY